MSGIFLNIPSSKQTFPELKTPQVSHYSPDHRLPRDWFIHSKSEYRERNGERETRRAHSQSVNWNIGRERTLYHLLFQVSTRRFFLKEGRCVAGGKGTVFWLISNLISMELVAYASFIGWSVSSMIWEKNGGGELFRNRLDEIPIALILALLTYY